jgi:hypothetical protein
VTPKVCDGNDFRNFNVGPLKTQLSTPQMKREYKRNSTIGKGCHRPRERKN